MPNVNMEVRRDGGMVFIRPVSREAKRWMKEAVPPEEDRYADGEYYLPLDEASDVLFSADATMGRIYSRFDASLLLA
jgi:hypothetical protein